MMDSSRSEQVILYNRGGFSMAYLKSYFVLVLFGFLGLGIGGITPNAKAASSANLDQGQNGTPSAPISPVEWVNGNVNASKAHYVEGYSVSYRAVITGLSTGAHNLK